jgi:uroporphyrinogen-III synthase
VGADPTVVAERAIAEGLLEAIDRAGLELAGRRVLLPRGRETRGVLEKGLRERGAEVIPLVLYETRPAPFWERPELRRALERVQVITLASGSAARALRGGLPEGVWNRKRIEWVAACIGPATAEVARAEGFRVEVVAERHTVEGLLEALVRWSASRRPS